MSAMRDLPQAGLLDELRGLQADLRRRGVAHVVLFGSRARNDHRPDSDIDLVVELEPTARLSLLDLIGIQHVVEDHTGMPANVLNRRALDGPFLENVERDAVQVF